MGKHTPGPVETLARIAMQREDYRTDMDLRDAVDAVLGKPIYDASPLMLEALKLHVAYEAVPADRGGKSGPKGRAWQAFVEARDAALASARGDEVTMGWTDALREACTVRCSERGDFCPCWQLPVDLFPDPHGATPCADCIAALSLAEKGGGK